MTFIWIAFFIIVFIFYYLEKPDFRKNVMTWFHSIFTPIEPYYRVFRETKESFSPKDEHSLCPCSELFPLDRMFYTDEHCYGIKGSLTFCLPDECCRPPGKDSTCGRPLYINPADQSSDFHINPDGYTEASAKRDAFPGECQYKSSPDVPRTKAGARTFWCKEGNTCKGRKEDPLQPANNQCGTASISQVPLPVFSSKDECEVVSFPCRNRTFEDCIQYKDCGWCMDRNGKGQCVSGTPEGPNDLFLNCTPSQGSGPGSWTPGTPNPYITPDIPSESANDSQWLPSSTCDSDTHLIDNEGMWREMLNGSLPVGLYHHVTS